MNSTERHEARYQRRKAARLAKRRARVGKFDDFDRVSDPNALLRAHWDTKKGVMFKASVIRYTAKGYHNSIRQSKNLRSGKDIRRGFYSFNVIERGKLREIHSLHYSERVVRRSVCFNALVPILSSNLIYDNGASLEGKGVSFAADRCEAHLHKFYRETGSNEGYVLVVDFKGYFDNILHGPLFDILDRYLLDPRLNALCRGFISAADDYRDPSHKGRGLFIGPEDSQIYAVAYPNSIDHKVKDQWRVRYYNRYMDDSYIIVKDKAAALLLRDMLFKEYAKLGIIPNKRKTQIVKLSRGFTYLKTKYFLTDTGKVIRKADHDSIARERRKLKKQHRLYMEGVMTLEQVVQSYMSWRGAILTRNAYDSVKSMDKLFFDLFQVRPWKKKKRRKFQK